MSVELEYYFLLFFTGSVLGWVMEVVCKLIQFRRFINRGFLIGPYCPIYGFGAVLVTALLSRFSDSPLAVFGQAVLVCGVLEYFTSWLMEKLFHARWWDYSQRRFNINGRVCANTLIPFGLLGLLMIYLVKPACWRFYASFPPALLRALCLSLLALMLADVVISSTVLGKIRQSASRLKGDSTEEITRRVRAALANESLLVRRQLHAFPYAKIYNKELHEKLRAEREALRAELLKRRAEFRAELEAAEKKLRAEMKK